MRDILRPLSRAWVGIIKKSHDAKSKAFGKDADLCRRFLDGPYDWMYTNQYSSQNGAFQMTSDENIPQTSFRMTTNKVADVVQLYGPSLYARNPHRMVSPKVFSELPFDLMIPPDAPPDDPRIQHAIQMQAQVDQRKLRVREATANVIQDLLNVTPNELDLEWHTRQAIDEALVTGLGCLWIEPYVAPGSRQQFIGSFYDSVDNLLMDPDMEQWKDLLWIARRRVMPRHLVERRYNLKPGTLKGSIESASMQGMIEARSAEYDYYRKRGETTDLSVFWEIYSRMGIGHNLSVGFDTRMRAAQSTLDQFGDHVYLVVSEEFPEGFLNLHEKHAAKEGIQESKKRVSWPTPFYKDPTDPWPCVRYYFHERSQTPWPSSHVKPALGELQFMNWTLSFLADKVKNTSRDFIALLEGAGEDIEAAIMDGVDLTVLKMKRNQGPLKDLIQFLSILRSTKTSWKSST
jgi:hypothetical protein